MRGAANAGAVPGLLDLIGWRGAWAGLGLRLAGPPVVLHFPFQRTWFPSYPTDAHLIRNDPGGGLIGTVGGTSKELTV